MDLRAYRQLQDSGWVREQRDAIERGSEPACPVAGCDGRLAPYGLDAAFEGVTAGVSPPGGVRCLACGATSRPVALWPRRVSTVGQAATTASINRGTDPRRLFSLLQGEPDWIVMKALEKDRTRRYETAADFAADVQRCLNDQQVLACPPSTWYRVRKIARRNKGPLLAASFVLLALVGGIVGTTWGLIRANHARVEADHEARQKDEALDAKEAALALAQRSERVATDKLWLSLYNQARARRFSRQSGQRLDSLEALTKAARLRPDDSLRDEAIAAMTLPDVRPGPTWGGLPVGCRLWAIDADYQRYACVDSVGVVRIRGLPDDREIQEIDIGPAKQIALLLSPDGQYVGRLEGDNTLKVWRIADKKAVLAGAPSQTDGWAFSPDGRQLAVARQDAITCFDLVTGRELNRWRLPDNAYHLAFHADNRRLAMGFRGQRPTSVYDAADGSLVTDLPAGSARQQYVAWHPDGERLAVGSSDGRIQIFDVAAKRKLATLEGHVQLIKRLSFHPDGDLLVSNSDDGTERLWEPSTARTLMQLTPNWGTGFSRDGRWLGAGERSGRQRLMEVVPPRVYRTLVSHLGVGQGEYNNESAVSPDGRMLALSMSDRLRLFRLSDGRQLADLPPGRPVFLSDGGGLLVVGSLSAEPLSGLPRAGRP
jgi:WD40 repeat protein